MNIKNQVWGLSLLPISVIKHWPEPTGGGKGSFQPTGYSLNHEGKPSGDQGRSLEPGIKAETIEKCCLLACLAFSLLQLRPTCPYMTPSTVGWVPYINQQARKGLQIYQRVSPSAEILSFQVGLSVYQVGKTMIFGVSTNHLCHLKTIDLN